MLAQIRGREFIRTFSITYVTVRTTIASFIQMYAKSIIASELVRVIGIITVRKCELELSRSFLALVVIDDSPGVNPQGQGVEGSGGGCRHVGMNH